MAYKSLIDKQLSMAFTAAKDLAVLATFHKSDKEFDFSTGTVSATVTTNITVKVVPTKKKTKETSKTVIVLFKSGDVGDLSLYTTVTLDGELYTIGATIISNTYTSMIELTRSL